MNKLCPFTVNQVNWFNKSLISWFNMIEGGKRAGKNIIEIQSFCAQLEEHPNKLHLVAGVSIATAMINLIDCDGFGIQHYFAGRCRIGEFNKRTALYVQTKVGEKIILISGGGKSNDYKLIKGNTYGMAIITEANECHKSFIKEVFDRTLSSDDRKIFHDLNPKPPKHWYYTELEAFHKEQQLKVDNYGFNYGHTTIADNMSIDDVKLKKVLSTYQKGTAWYKRDILGLRVVAEGLIYGRFANNQNDFIIDDIPQNANGFIVLGVDFGGTGSGHAFNATFISNNFKFVATIVDYWNDEEMDSDQLANEYVKFIKLVNLLYPRFNINACYADSAEQVLIRTLRASSIKAGLNVPIKNATKGRILNRINFYKFMFGFGVYKVLKRCKYTIDAFETALWEDKGEDASKEDKRLDDGTTNVDTLDAQEYSTEKWMNIIMKVNNYS